jgi:hypothetical protein
MKTDSLEMQRLKHKVKFLKSEVTLLNKQLKEANEKLKAQKNDN